MALHSWQPEPSRAPSVASGPSTPPATILVVDDTEDSRAVLARLLRLKGYAVLEVEGGQQALEAVETQEIDLVFLDIMMPDVSGPDVLKLLRQRRSADELPVVMASALNETEHIGETLSLGANDYVTKPLDPAVVLARTEAHLTRKRANAEIRRLNQELARRNRFIQETFGRYLSDEVVASLLERPEGTRLGGERRTVTLLMSDLRGFTALAERLSPEQVVRLLNNYLGAMADVITRFQGTIDEFIGDGILALFGAPVAREGDPERAAACAVAMQLAMGDVNERNRQHGLPPVRMGVAVNTGEVIVGNIGSETRAKYGVVGTHVNLTARIESFTLGSQVLVSESTVRAAGPCLGLGERLTFQAKGFSEPVTVDELRSIGPPYDLVVPDRREELALLRREIPVRFQVIHGTHVQGEALEGRILKASSTAALISASGSAPAHSSLRLRLTGPDGRESPADLYAKVTADPAEEGCFIISITSASPEIVQILQEAVVAAPERLRRL